MRFIAMHLGLGDAVAFAPLVVKLAKDGPVTVPCYTHNLPSVKSFFVNHPEVSIVEVRKEEDMSDLISSYDSLLLGNYNPENPPLANESFIDWHYRGAGVDVKERWQYCPLQKASERFDDDFDETPFVHDDRVRGYRITKKLPLEYGSPGKCTKGILGFSNNIRYAREIHCIDSSFLHLAEALKTTGKLYWHQYARPYDPLSNYKLRKEWTIIK